jgi:hypothetical protein
VIIIMAGVQIILIKNLFTSKESHNTYSSV